ncbi:hypothetical protein [Mesorhizobium sp. WSM4983]|uniref:hypothetical protein n=1 Tax=Mesorhizobium sp. WSM4983 TaxID=3038540 RepID=UPI003FA52AE9
MFLLAFFRFFRPISVTTPRIYGDLAGAAKVRETESRRYIVISPYNVDSDRRACFFPPRQAGGGQPSGKGLGTPAAHLGMTLRHTWQVAMTIASTFVAATLQLLIPHSLRRAIDQAQGVMVAGGGTAAEQALRNTALTLLAVSVVQVFSRWRRTRPSAIRPAMRGAWPSARCAGCSA